MKKAIALILLLAGLIVGIQWTVPDPGGTAAPVTQGPGSVRRDGDGPQVPVAAPEVTARRSIAPAAQGDGLVVGVVPEAAIEGGSLLRVVDIQGLPVPNVVGVWVGQALDVVALDFDERGCAVRPTEEPGQVFVRAEGRLGRAALVGRAVEDDADVQIELRPTYVLRGIVRVDGAPPGEPVFLRRMVSCEQYGASWDMTGIWDRLVALGMPPLEVDVRVPSGGDFALNVEWELDPLPLRSPAHLRVNSVNGTPPRFGHRWVAADLGVSVIEVNLTRVPAIIGRLMWDDGQPAAGEHLSLFSQSDPGDRPSFESETTYSDGSFAVPVEGRTARLSTSGRRLSDDLPMDIDLVGAVYPLDLGVVKLRRPPRIEVEVVGRRGGVERPVVALVSTAFEGGWTDQEGRIVLEFDPLEPIEILAEGYRSHRTGPVPIDSVLRVVLEPGAGLTVTVDDKLNDARFSGGLSVRLAFDRSPFDSAIEVGSPGARSFSTSLYFGFQRGQNLSWGFDVSDAGAAGALVFGVGGHSPLVVPGLKPGAELRVELVDPLGAVLSSQRVVAEIGGTTVTFDAAKIEFTTLTLDAHWADGSPIKQGRVRVRGRGRGVGASSYYFNMHAPAEKRVLGPIAPCVVGIESDVPGAKNVVLDEVHVGASGVPNAVVLDLER